MEVIYLATLNLWNMKNEELREKMKKGKSLWKAKIDILKPTHCISTWPTGKP